MNFNPLEFLRESFLDAEGFDIEKKTLKNTNYRKVLFTTPGMQIVVMSIKPGENIPLEKHNGPQFFKVVSGHAKVVLISPDDGEMIIKYLRPEIQNSIAIGKNIKHEVHNTKLYDDLKIYSIYSPPQFMEGTIQRRQA